MDKTPGSLWVMEISARLFGVNPWSILVPQALEGVAAVGLLHATVRRWFGPAAGLLAGAVLALTPVAVLMFRFNNPDALLVLLLVAAAYATVRAIEHGRLRWLVLAGALVGFGFLAKMLQALLVVPAFALGYALFAPGGVGRRLRHLAIGGLAMLGAAGWWMAIVSLWPASSRPYIGGSQDNSVLGLMLGYNGLGRLDGSETGSVGGGNGWGATGWTRLFGSEMGGQVAWLLPAALILLVAGAHYARRRAAFVVWGGWLLVTGLTFSFMRGIIHPYYTVALAPAIGALVGMGAVTLWRHRSAPGAAGSLAAAVAVTALWSAVLLGRTSGWYPWLRVLIVVLGLAAAVALLAGPRLRGGLAAVVLSGALVAGLAGSAAYAGETAATAHTGAIPSAGPAAGFSPGFAPRPSRGFSPAFSPGFSPRGGFGGGGAGGLLNATTPGAALVALLQKNAGGYGWVAAAVGSNNAAGYQLATGYPVMSLGGFNGSDPAPTLAQFQAYVAAHRIHYFIGGTGMRADSGSDAANQIATWVAAHYPSTTVDGVTVYDLTS